MNLKRAKYLLALVLSFAMQMAHAQLFTPIDGSVNVYTSITDIRSLQDWNSDSVVVGDTNGFNVQDTVMVYCVKGAIIGTGQGSSYPPGDPGYDPGVDATDPRNTGKYAFYLISEIIGDTIILNASLNPEIRNMEIGELAQLIKVRSYRYANVTGTGLSAPSWNPATGTGGVIALFVHGILRLDGNIDVSGDGFRGAPGSTDLDYLAGCADPDTMQYFYQDGEVVAGLKGEGITDTSFPYVRGKASSINGGGGGNGLSAGGGGGSNARAGVTGGEQTTSCTPGDSLTGGMGGFDLRRNYYVNGNPLQRGNRIFFGGGGGSGTQRIGTTSTDGGNGGGIVVIVADTILGNGGGIYANGGDVAGTAVDGAGAGGGGGGCIVLDVAGYQGTIPISAVGGDGGNSSSTGADTLGMGGAGGGGIYWYAGTSSPPGLSASTATGTNGVFESDPPYDILGAASPPLTQRELVAPLRGFIFNPVPSEFWICSDQDPEPIVTSEPKGGDGVGSYTYQWIDSSRFHTDWEDIVGATSKDYDPGPLSDTTYFRRIVNSAGLADTSFRIVVYVHPEITGNTIAASDTVCSDNAPELFESAATIGGGPTGGTFNYLWQHLPDGAGDYTDLTAISTEPTYQAGSLTISANYRRIAYAGVCVDTSNAERVQVFETITGNDITPYDTICVNTAPDLISGPVPSEGDQDDIRYQWLTSTSPVVMGSLIPGATGISYQSAALSQTTYIRRVVLSGNGDACRDTSAFVEILNIPAITSNTISASQTVCQQDQADMLNGSSPGGGIPGQYNYTWIASTDQNNWVPAGGGNDVMSGYDPGVMTGDTTWYSRVVGSGGLELVCKDTSDAIVINVLPSITNNIITPADDVKCQWDQPELISGSLPGGGATVSGNDLTREFRWELAQIEGTPGPGNWNHPLTGADAQDYMDPDPLLSDVDRWYRRIVTSGPAAECADTSNLVRLVVHTGITANTIDDMQAICFNDASAPALRHEALSGGEDTIVAVYTWRRWLEGESSGDAVDIGASDFQQYAPPPYTDPANLIYYYDRMVEIGACLDTSNAMQVTVMQLPGGELTDENSDVCEKYMILNMDLNMAALTPGHFELPWEVHLENGVNTEIETGLVYQDTDTMGIWLDTDEAAQVSFAFQIESIRYYPEEGNDYACISPPELLTGDPVLIDVSREPKPQIQVDEPEVCNDTAILVINPDNGFLSYWSDPAGSVYFSPATGEDEYYVYISDLPDEYGEYRIYARSEAGDCAGLDSIDLHFFEQPAPAIAGDSIILFLTDEVQLNADPPTAGEGTWTWENGSVLVVDPNDPNTEVSGLKDGDNTFTWTVRNGEKCISSSDVNIVQRNKVKRYNGFSPNGDMSNEYYIMQGLPYAEKFTIIFINSLGSTVRTIDQDNYSELEWDESLIEGGLKEDEMVIWDGRADNGNLVASGTYYYVLKFVYESIEFTDKDYVVVVRE